jgi:hypothetical protein
MIVVSGFNPTVLRLLPIRTPNGRYGRHALRRIHGQFQIVRAARLTLHGQIKNVIITWPTLTNVNGFRHTTSEVPPPKSPTT